MTNDKPKKIAGQIILVSDGRRSARQAILGETLADILNLDTWTVTSGTGRIIDGKPIKDDPPKGKP